MKDTNLEGMVATDESDLAAAAREHQGLTGIGEASTVEMRDFVVSGLGLEPRTNALKGRCSTN